MHAQSLARTSAAARLHERAARTSTTDPQHAAIRIGSTPGGEGMSRAKRARRAGRRRAATPSPPASAGSGRTPKPLAAEQPTRRIETARRRVATAKLVVAAAALAGFAATFGFARVSYAGHSKKPLRPLAAPPRYLEVVRQNLLQAGIVAPTQAPPDAATSTS
jgi:hypothetical protein